LSKRRRSPAIAETGSSDRLLFAATSARFRRRTYRPVIVGEIIGWRWWKVIDGGLFTFNGFKPIPKGPFEVDFPQRGGMAAFRRRDAAERMFASLTAKWPSYPKAVTFQSELPAGAPRVVPDAHCLGSIELWGTVHEYKRGFLGQFVCVKSVDRIAGTLSAQGAAAALAALQKRYLRIS
jgi:hypothetical protein